jgi:type II secretory pathway pseudopilin PulG
MATRARAADQGFTLIELVIYAALLVLVLAAVGSILVGALKAQTNVRTIGRGIDGSQLVLRSVGAGIRNSSSFKAEAPTADGQLLRARVATGSSGLLWQCRAWYWSSTTGGFYTTANPLAMVPVPLTGVVPAGWTLLASSTALPSGTTQPFTSLASGGQLKLAVTVSAGSGSHPVVLSTIFSRYPQSDLTTNPVSCF